MILSSNIPGLYVLVLCDIFIDKKTLEYVHFRIIFIVTDERRTLYDNRRIFNGQEVKELAL